jgi:hypothetical protein
LSPVHSDYRGFPLAILNNCTCDLLPSSNIVRAHRKLRQADVVADLCIYEG